MTFFFIRPATQAAAGLRVNGSTGNDSLTRAQVLAGAGKWQTIGRAAWGSTDRASPNTSEAAQAGDTVIIEAGTYSVAGQNNRYEVAWNPANSGTAGNLITFQAEGLVTLQLSSGTGPLIGSNNRDYIKWDGFYIDEDNATFEPDTGTIVFYYGDDCIVTNCEINGNNAAFQDNHNAIRLDFSNRVTVSNNLIYDVLSITADPWHHNAAAIMSYSSKDVIVEHNEIRGCGAGVYPKGESGGITQSNWTVRYNNIYNCYEGIRMENVSQGSSNVYGNVIHAGAGTAPSPTSGISIGGNCSLLTIANNIIDEQTIGIYWNIPTTIDGIVIKNNIISNCTYGNWEIDSTSNSYPEAGDTWYQDYNTYYNCSTIGQWEGTDYNTIAAWRTFTSNEDNSNTVDPQYQDRPNDDFHTNNTSNTCIDILDLDEDSDTTDTVYKGAYAVGDETVGRI